MELENSKIFIYHLIFSPQKAIEYLIKSKEDKYMGTALLVMVFGVIFNLFSKAIVSLNRGLINIYLGFGGLIVILNFIGNLVLFTGIIFFIKSFTLSKKEKSLYQSKNRAALFFKLVCFSFIPFIFTPVISLFGLFLSLDYASYFYYILKIAIYFWIIFLQIMVIKKIFNLKILTSIALYILPLIGLFAFIFIKIINISLSIISMLI